MNKNQQQNLSLNKIKHDNNNCYSQNIVTAENKFVEIATSLAYYLKLFSSLKRFLEYIFLASKYLFQQEFSLLIPLDENGNIWLDNIFCSSDLENKKIEPEIIEFLSKSSLTSNFKIKDISIFDQYLNDRFPNLLINSNKIVSRGKCRGFYYVFVEKSNTQISDLDLTNINFLVDILAVGIENYLLLKKNKKHENVDREIASGAEIQSRLLPDYCPKIYQLDLAAHCRPALQLGGDYYDFMSIKPNTEEKIRQKGRWALVIGDVMGKGIPAGLLMTMLRGMLRAEVLTGLPPDRILHDLNQLAMYDLDQSHRFVTLFYSDYDPRTKKLRYANAAHNPPLMWNNSQQKVIKLDAEGFVLGLQKDADYKCGEIKLNKSDVILYYTDGITETSNKLGERYGEHNLIVNFSNLCKKNLSSQEIVNQIFKTLDYYSGKNKPLDDDASVVIFKLE